MNHTSSQKVENNTRSQNAVNATANREKWIVAFSSVMAAVLLTGMKVVVGFLTMSLGILSEAAHSALDLIAALVTCFAVRVSGHPADHKHTYGHGKVENLSALFETVLLLVTCVWIIYEAVQRLFFKHVDVQATFWAFAIMIISIVIDFSRSRALRHVAQKYGSQALEADALHFSTDIWSSSVVVCGLVMVLVSQRTGILWLQKADAVAALGVAAIVVWVSIELGRKTIADLLDEIPPGIREGVLRALHLPGVREVRRVRMRRSGPENFVDVTLRVDPATTLQQGHEIANSAETAIQRILPRADVVVHVEPSTSVNGNGRPSLPEIVRDAARHFAIEVHNIHYQDVLGKGYLDVHLEVSDALSVGTAHSQATSFEKIVRDRYPGLDRIVTHIEPMQTRIVVEPMAPLQEEEIVTMLSEAARQQAGHCHPHDIRVYKYGDELVVSLHCTVDADKSIRDAHILTEQLELNLRSRFPHINRVVIHVEPPEPQN